MHTCLYLLNSCNYVVLIIDSLLSSGGYVGLIKYINNYLLRLSRDFNTVVTHIAAILGRFYAYNYLTI